MELDLYAPIIPAKSAANIEIGANIKDIECIDKFDKELLYDNNKLLNVHLYKSDSVIFWVENEIIYEILVYNNYQGKLMDKIGLGSTPDDVEREIGPWDEDIYDNLIIKDISGLFFLLEAHKSRFDKKYFDKNLYYKGPGWCLDCHKAPIKEFYVYNPERGIEIPIPRC